jgi:hypothetical protein
LDAIFPKDIQNDNPDADATFLEFTDALEANIRIQSLNA